MPSATPMPRVPSHLTLFGAGDLLASGGCPLCRYVAEAADRHAIWFAMEAHAQPETITRLCRTLGWCPRHTRDLLTQPGAGPRLTVVYRHVLEAGRAYLEAARRPAENCSFCAHDAEAADRALDALLTGLHDDEIRHRYQAAGGLCLPHLRFAVAHSPRRQAVWLADTARPWLAGGHPDPRLLVGEPEPDTDTRMRLRAVLPVATRPGATGARSQPTLWEGCVICLSTAQAEREAMSALTGCGLSEPGQTWPALCTAHLREAWAGACLDRHHQDAPWAVKHEAAQAAAWLGTVTSAHRMPLRRRYARTHGGLGDIACAVCLLRDDAEDSAAMRVCGNNRRGSARGPGPGEPPLCLRHAIILRERSRTAEPVTRIAGKTAGLLIRDLQEAFRMRAWENRGQPRGPEMDAWRHAAGFIDGRVYGGGPATTLSEDPSSRGGPRNDHAGPAS